MSASNLHPWPSRAFLVFVRPAGCDGFGRRVAMMAYTAPVAF